MEEMTVEEWMQQYGLTEDDTTDVDDVEGKWEDVRTLQ